jgi:hypothetical protein
VFELILRAAEVREELLVGGRLLQGVQVGPVEVLEQGITQQVFVIGGPDDGGDDLESGFTTGPKSSLAGDEFIGRGSGRSHHDRLEQADLLDGEDQFRHRLLVEDGAWLARVGGDRFDGEFGVGRAGHGGQG